MQSDIHMYVPGSVDGPGRDSRMGLDTIAVEVAGGGAGVEVVAIGGDVSRKLEMYVSYSFVCLQKPPRS